MVTWWLLQLQTSALHSVVSDRVKEKGAKEGLLTLCLLLLYKKKRFQEFAEDSSMSLYGQNCPMLTPVTRSRQWDHMTVVSRSWQILGSGAVHPCSHLPMSGQWGCTLLGFRIASQVALSMVKLKSTGEWSSYFQKCFEHVWLQQESLGVFPGLEH